MDKLTRRVTGVFNSIKEALPTFEETDTSSSWQADIPEGGDSPEGSKTSSQHQPTAPKSFLFPDFLTAASSSSAASPLASPMIEASARSLANFEQFSCRDVQVSQAIVEVSHPYL